MGLNHCVVFRLGKEISQILHLDPREPQQYEKVTPSCNFCNYNNVLPQGDRHGKKSVLSIFRK